MNKKKIEDFRFFARIMYDCGAITLEQRNDLINRLDVLEERGY